MEPLLSTKLYIPPTRPELVPRQRLIERLNESLDCKLTLISAPAGFGKTTLVSEWVTGCECPTAWLSLDEDDNDTARFLTYFITALNRVEGIEANMGEGALSMLHSPQPPPVEVVLTSLINDGADIPDRIILVLDDYHVIDAKPVNNALTFLLEHLPPQMHLVIATREDPHLPLSRLRARGQLTELRAADLRFTSIEAAEFLNDVMGLYLSTVDIAALETRTEGWIAGLQFAAISMQGSKDATGFIKSFTGSHRYVLDYLVEEVLEQQSETIQSFLLQTSVLDRLNASLCNALLDQQDGQEYLEFLEHANLFVIPLDEERHWYRYHHLFADLLRQRLKRTQPEKLPILHRRASKWHEQNSMGKEAVDHALAAQDFERAAGLIEEQVDAVWQRGEHAKILGWLNMLPKEQFSTRPHLSIFHAWVQLEDGRVKAAELSLRAVEQAIKTNAANEPEKFVYPNSAHLKSRASVMHAMLGFRTADAPSIIKFSTEALESLPEKDLSWRGIAAMALGDSHYIVGDMNGAYKALSEAIRISKTAGNIYMTAYTSIKLAIILQYQGKLHQAQEICRELLTLMYASGLSRSALTGLLHAQWGEILWDLNDVDNAFQYVSRGLELSKLENDVANLVWAHIVLVKVLYAKRDLTGAMDTILKLEKIARKSHVPPWIVNRVAAWKARIWLTERNLVAIDHWVQGRQLNKDDELIFAREVEYIVLARILIMKGELYDAVNLLERLIEKAEAGDRITRLIEMLLVLALAKNAQGDIDNAVVTLLKSLSLAASGGHIRIFVDEGPSIEALLRRVKVENGKIKGHISTLLATFEEKITGSPSRTQPLIEPLSERELEVLHLIAQGLTNQEISSRLYLSLNTVKVHTRNIYGKLGVNNRTQAVARANGLGILLYA